MAEDTYQELSQEGQLASQGSKSKLGNNMACQLTTAETAKASGIISSLLVGTSILFKFQHPILPMRNGDREAAIFLSLLRWKWRQRQDKVA